MGCTETKYLGFLVIKYLLGYLASKVESIKSINTPTKVRDVRRFVGLVNDYWDIWRKRAYTLAPLTNICSTNVKFKLTDLKHNAFIDMKKIAGRDVLLYYPNFSGITIIHADAIKTQIRGLTIPSGNLIAFYSRKLSPTKNIYTTT